MLKTKFKYFFIFKIKIFNLFASLFITLNSKIINWVVKFAILYFVIIIQFIKFIILYSTLIIKMFV